MLTPTDGWTPAGAAGSEVAESLRRQRPLGDLHNEGERLRDELARGDAWAFAPQAEFDALVGDMARWKLRVRGVK